MPYLRETGGVGDRASAGVRTRCHRSNPAAGPKVYATASAWNGAEDRPNVISRGQCERAEAATTAAAARSG